MPGRDETYILKMARAEGYKKCYAEWVKPPITEREKIRRGDLLGGILGVKYIKKESRYKTEWGTKTALGLYETAKRIIEDGPEIYGGRSYASLAEY